MTTIRTYKLRKFKNGSTKTGGAFMNYSLTVPTSIAEKLPEDMLFECELTDDGILFKPVNEPEVSLPAWANEKAQTNGGKKRSRPVKVSG